MCFPASSHSIFITRTHWNENYVTKGMVNTDLNWLVINLSTVVIEFAIGLLITSEINCIYENFR